MIQIIASNPISASSFRRGLARRARANGASPRASPDVVPRRATITYADDELTRASPPPISRYHRRRRIRGGDPQSRRSRTPRARPRRRPRGRAPGSRARARVTTPGRSPVAIAADFRAVRCRAGLGVFDETPEDDAAPAAAFDAALDDLLDAEDEEADASGDDDADASVDASLDASFDDDETPDASSASDSSPKKTAACSAAP